MPGCRIGAAGGRKKTFKALPNFCRRFLVLDCSGAFFYRIPASQLPSSRRPPSFGGFSSTTFGVTRDHLPLGAIMIVRGHRELMRRYEELKPGDVFIGLVGDKVLRQSLLIDCLQRGIRCYPSALAQTLHHFKTAQARILGRWMLPLTRVISRRSDLLAAAGTYGEAGITAVVTKQDHMHCGHGVRKWESAELLYNLAGFSPEAFPFVLQPFLESFTDIRVVMAGDHREAYVRSNPGSFRKNLSAGGKSSPHELTPDQTAFCQEVMTRARFPYAHLDLHITEDGRIYLSEITLNGGLKGAKISRVELDRRKQLILESQAAKDGADAGG
jgi:ribosomal protein S6--L-glutamate ligase